MVKDLHDTGWGELKLNTSLLEAQENFISLKERLVCRDGTNLQLSEIHKAYVRARLRYSTEGFDFVQRLSKVLVESDSRFRNYFITLPYIILHLPNDKNEGAGSIHKDTVLDSGNMFTCWTQLNSKKLEYAPLTIFPNSFHINFPRENKLVQLINKVLKKIIHSTKKRNHILEKVEEAFCNFTTVVPTIEGKDLYVGKHISYFWNSSLYHHGNLNKGRFTHSSCVLRISEKPLYYEPSVCCKNLLNTKLIDTEEVDFLTVKRKVKFICKSKHKVKYKVISKSTLDYINETFEIKSKLSIIENKYLSFIFSLLAQRTSRDSLAFKYDLTSLILGEENLISLERLLNKCTKYKTDEFILNSLGLINVDSRSYQMNLLLRKFDIKTVKNEFISSW